MKIYFKWFFIAIGFLMTIASIIWAISLIPPKKVNSEIESLQSECVYIMCPGPESKIDRLREEEKTAIVIHSTANFNSNIGIRFHCEYLDTTKRDVSWHFTIGNDTVSQHYPLSAKCWHARGCNIGSIGIEILENQDLKKVIYNLDGLISEIKNIYPNVVVRLHSDCGKGSCPNKIIASNDYFIQALDLWNRGDHVFYPPQSFSGLVFKN